MNWSTIDLRRVDEVAELGLPQHERLRRLHRVAVLEAQAGDLAQRRVVQLHRRERAGQRLDRRHALAGLGVVQHEVALGERAALDVLAGQAHRRALGQQRRVGEALGLRPVDAALGADGLAPALELLDELGVHGEAVGDRQQLLVERLQALGRDRGLDLRRGRAVELVAARRLLGVGRGQLLLELAVARGEAVPDLLRDRVGLLLGEHPALDELAGVDLADGDLLLDLGRHLGLRVRGLVGLVVAVAAVADQVDHDVVAELLAEREREPHGGDAGRHVVGVDVDDRDVEALREVRGPARGARVVGVRREADLVVLDQVQRAADGVAVERLQVEGLRHDALAREGRVAVQDDRDRRR